MTLHSTSKIIHPLHQLETVAECACQLKLLTTALDVNDLKLESSLDPCRQELVRLRAAGLELDIKESLLEAMGLVLLANNQLDPQTSGELFPVSLTLSQLTVYILNSRTGHCC